MKKILVILGVLVMSAGMGCASGCDDFRCPANPYDGTLSFSNFTGVNFLAERLGNAIIKKAILKNSKGKYKVNLQSYNTTALKRGEFKSLEIKGTDTVTEGIYISNVKLKTLCDYNYIEINNKDNVAIFQKPFGMLYTLQFNQNDLNSTMQGASYKEMIRKINSIGNTYKLFNISSTSAKIENNKLYYTFNAVIPLLKMKQDITLETDIRARGGQIVLNNAKLVSNSFKVDMSKLQKILNYLNPLEFAMGIFAEQDAKTKIEEITIKDNIINLTGIMVIEEGTVTDL